MGKTEATTALPGLTAIASHCCQRGQGAEQRNGTETQKGHGDLRLGTDGTESVNLAFPGFKGFSAETWAKLAANRGVLALAAGFALTAGVWMWAAVAAGYRLPDWWVLGTLALVAGVAERQGVLVTKNIEMSISFLPIVFAAVAFGPLAAAVVGASANFLDLRPPYLRWFVYTPARALTACMAGIAATAVAPKETSFNSILLASFLAAATYVGSDGLINTLVLVVRKSASIFAYVRTIGPLTAVSLPLQVPLVALLVFAYRNYALWVVVIFLLPALAMQRLIHLYQQQRAATNDLAEVNQRLEQANLSFATALVATLDARDEYTAGHSAAVAIYSRDIAVRMGLSEREQQLAHVAGLVHDIGKIGLPAGLLEKAGPLTLDERRQMEEHSAIGERILAKVEDYEEIAKIVRHHHERVDGMGYPDRLEADEIPPISRIIAVADAYNAMTSDRPYREAMPSRVARLRLAQAVETQFDTAVVAAFEAVLVGAQNEYRTGTGSEFGLVAKTAYPTLPTATANVAA
jgi:putative nucleotidyltransferase with HDIG domain